MKIDYSHRFRDNVELVGYEMIGEYVNSSVLVKLICDSGHIFSIRPNNFNNGQRCSVCSGKNREYAKSSMVELLYKEGYMHKSEYINSNTKMKLLCPENHEWNVTPNDFKKGIRCPKCGNKCKEQSKQDFINLVEECSYTLHEEYTGVMNRVLLECDRGHKYRTRPNDFKKGYRCKKCYTENVIQKSFEGFKFILNENGYKLKDDYINSTTKIYIICPEGHDWYVAPNDFINHNTRCPHCQGSSGQRRLQEFLTKHIDRDVVYNDRKTLDGLELDIYYPDLKIAVEYQGDYWHTLPMALIRDKRKRMLCEKKNIKLIEVWEKYYVTDEDNINNEVLENIKLFKGQDTYGHIVLRGGK
jgi:hypothetical protein